MAKNFVCKIFEKWIKDNHNRFNHIPHSVENHKNSFTFKFSGIAPELKGYINNYGFIEIGVYFQGQLWDIVKDFDCFPRRDSNGQYYCNECKLTYKYGGVNCPPIMYSSKEELWCDHSLEMFLKWANEKLNASNCLCLNGGKGAGFREAKIVSKNEAYAGEWPLIIPVVNHNNRN